MKKLPLFAAAAVAAFTLTGAPMTAHAASFQVAGSGSCITNCNGQSMDINSLLSQMGVNGSGCITGLNCSGSGECGLGWDCSGNNGCSLGQNCGGQNCSLGQNCGNQNCNGNQNCSDNQNCNGNQNCSGNRGRGNNQSSGWKRNQNGVRNSKGMPFVTMRR